MREVIVSTEDAVRSLCSSLRGSEYIAVDTEFMRECTYAPEFCLLQLCNGAVAAVVDVLHLPNRALEPVWEILKSRAVTKGKRSGGMCSAAEGGMQGGLK